MISNIPFWLSVTFKDQPHSWVESVLETADNYFYLGGKKAYVIGPLLNGSRRIEIEVGSSSFLGTALKVISYFTLVLPLVVLIAKLILRSIYHFHTETELNKQGNDFIPLKAGVWKALPNDIKGNILPFLSAKAALTIYPRLEKKTADVSKKLHSQVIAAYLAEKSADKSLEKLSKDLYLKLIQEAGSNLKKLDLSYYDNSYRTGLRTSNGTIHYKDAYLLNASKFCQNLEELTLWTCPSLYGESLYTFQSIPAFKNLKFLELSVTDLTNANLDVIAEKYSHLQGLTFFFDPNEAHALDFIQKFSNLTYLHILYSVQFQVYINHPSCSKIKKMRINVWSTEPEELSQIFYNYINLEELEVSLSFRFPFVDDIKPPVFTDLSPLKKLRKLKICAHPLDLKPLFEGLPQLEYLDLSYSTTFSYISDMSITYPSRQAMKSLNLYECKISIAHLLILINCYPNLREINLSTCKIDDRIIKKLAIHCTELKLLNISFCTFLTKIDLKLMKNKLPNLKIVK